MYFFMQRGNHRASITPVYGKTESGHDVNLSPPTEEDKQQVDQTKDELGDDQTAPKPPTQPDSKATVSPFISYAALEGQTGVVNGYVGGVFEEGGTCTATFTRGSAKIVKTTTGFQDSDHTTCPPFNVARGELASAGTWDVILSYTSNTSTGSSPPSQVDIK
jgi:hypothetical protein